MKVGAWQMTSAEKAKGFSGGDDNENVLKLATVIPSEFVKILIVNYTL